MARPVRLWRRFVPRFGILSIFVGMLLVVSAAGWWKFHRDLYVEEVEVIRALKGMAGRVTVRRTGLVQYPPPPEEDFDGPIPWNAPLLPPVQRLYVVGNLSADLHDAAARLPRLKTFSFEEGGFVSSPTPFDIASHLNRSLPELPEPTLSVETFSVPMAEGEEVEAHEHVRVAKAIHEAWHDERPIPPSLLAVSREKALLGGRIDSETVVHIVEPDRRFHSYERDRYYRTVFLAEGIRYDFARHGNAWQLETRDCEAELPEDDEVFRRFPTDEYPYLGADFFGFLTISRAIESMPQLELGRIAKVDDVRYRVDFKPFAAPNDERDSQLNAIDPQVTEWSLVLRSDMGWAPEESKIVQQIQQTSWPAPKQHERRLSQRFHRERKYVLLTERIVEDSTVLPGGGGTVSEFSQYVYAYDIDPEYHERIFDSVSFDPEPWAPRRELPWLRWYRVTFLLACGLIVAITARAFHSVRASAEEGSKEVKEKGEEATAEA